MSSAPVHAPRATILDPRDIAQWLRRSAAYHRERRSYVTASLELLATLRKLGVALDAPVTRVAGELTPDQADRYADAIDPRQEGAA